MSISGILQVLQSFVTGADFDEESSNGQIHITHWQWNELVEKFLIGPEGRSSPKVSGKLQEIQELNRRLESEIMDDPEPFETLLLKKCGEFLEIFGKLPPSESP